MKVVKKKSIDKATNAVLVKANRQHIELAWDRSEAMQPQCGFGRMSICCTDCADGPCRTSPFDADPGRSVCGRSQQELVASRFLGQAIDGAVALAGLAAEFEAEIDNSVFKTLCISRDAMLAPSDLSARLSEIGGAAASALKAISSVKEMTYGKSKPSETTANLGSLKADSVNIVLHGHIAPKIIKKLTEAAAKSGTPVNITAMCGSETNGGLNMPVLTNYCSQEAPLVTGSVDLLVAGSQCVMPALLTLARAANVVVIKASDLSSESEINNAVKTASDAYQIRKGKSVDIPACAEKVCYGYTAAGNKPLFTALNAAYGKGSLKGTAYIGGCGSVSETQDAQFVQLVEKLLADKYFIVTGGCAGAALAKTGMCSADYAAGTALKGVLPAGVPPVLYIGACNDAGEFLAIARAVKESGMPVYAFMPETVHNKILATSIAFVSAGITTFIDSGEATSDTDLGMKGKLRSVSDFGKVSGVFGEAAAVK